MKIFLVKIFSAALILILFTNGCSGIHFAGKNKTPLVIFAAGSLIIPFTDLEKAFESKYPDIDIQAQYHGSIQVIRQATELHVPIDVVATADASLLPMLMYANNDPNTGKPYATWYFEFATNHLAIAYRPISKYADQITTDNWYEVLARPDVKVGLADPRFDAVGYRALMVYALANDYYNQPIIFTDMFKGQFTYPLGIFHYLGMTTVTVPEILETKAGSHIILRGASMELIALLESGDLDYAYEYESVIQQHQLSMLKLPDELNLGNDAYQQFYNTVQVKEDFVRFASVKPVFQGARIGYGITIPSNAPHPQQASLFISFLLSPEGRAILDMDHQPMFDPAICDNMQNMPADLQSYCSPSGTP
jgi:molybdate/tungstate transport system substrate-binding protein